MIHQELRKLVNQLNSIIDKALNDFKSELNNLKSQQLLKKNKEDQAILLCSHYKNIGIQHINDTFPLDNVDNQTYYDNSHIRGYLYYYQGKRAIEFDSILKLFTKSLK